MQPAAVYFFYALSFHTSSQGKDRHNSDGGHYSLMLSALAPASKIRLEEVRTCKRLIIMTPHKTQSLPPSLFPQRTQASMEVQF